MNWLSHMGLQKKSYIYVGSGLLAIIILVTLLSFQTINQSIDYVSQQRLLVAENVARGIDELVSHMRTEAKYSAYILGNEWQDNADFVSFDQLKLENDRIQYHVLAFHQMDVVVTSALLDSKGNVLQMVPFVDGQVGQNKSGTLAISTALNSGQVFVEVGKALFTQENPTLSIVVPVTDEQEIIRGLFVVDVPGFPNAIGFGSLLQYWSTNYDLELIDNNGNVLIGGSNTVGNEKSRHWAEIEALMHEKPSGVAEHREDEQEKAHIVSFALLNQVPWAVTVEQPTEIILELPIIILQRMLIAMGIALLIAIGLIWGFTRQIIRPIQTLATMVEYFGTGNLQAEIPYMGEDEIGVLARNFEGMRQQLKESLDEINLWNKELEHRVNEAVGEQKVLNRQLQQQNEERRNLLGKIITSQEEERRRIARELHDDLSQTLTGLVINIATAEMLTNSDPKAAKKSLESIRLQTSEAVEEVRRLMRDLRPSLLDDLGLVPAISWYAENYIGPSGIEAKLEILGSDQRLSPSVEIVIFRVIQEAITNVVKHSQAKTVNIGINFSPSAISGSVEDDGIGFNIASLDQASSEGMGLLGMQERIELLKGTFTIESHPQKGGTRVYFEIPLEENSG